MCNGAADPLYYYPELKIFYPDLYAALVLFQILAFLAVAGLALYLTWRFGKKHEKEGARDVE